MIQNIDIKNLGPLKEVKTDFSENINLVIGKNDTGKTLLLKAMYVALRALENFQRGKEPKGFKKLLDEKLYWTFQLEKLGDLVRKGSEDNKMRFEAGINGHSLLFNFSSSAVKGVGECSEIVEPRNDFTVFIPAKEVLSIENVVRKSREIDREFGFDDTFYDLIQFLDKPTARGGGKHVTEARKQLRNFIGGELLQDNKKGWYFKKGKAEFDIQITAEGIKKIAILDRLIGNKVLKKGTVLFIDEPEAHLHPEAILFLMDILKKLCKQGVQVIMSTHSYFVIKKLSLIAREEDWHMPLLSLAEKEEGKLTKHNLQQGLPDIPIIKAAVHLYQQELDIALA